MARTKGSGGRLLQGSFAQPPGRCAHYEEIVNEENEVPDRESLGYFLVDATLGMLSAPSTVPAGFLLAGGRSFA